MPKLDEQSAFEGVGAADRKRPAASHDQPLLNKVQTPMPSENDIMSEEMPLIITDLLEQVNNKNAAQTILRARLKWFSNTFNDLHSKIRSLQETNDQLQSRINELEAAATVPQHGKLKLDELEKLAGIEPHLDRNISDYKVVSDNMRELPKLEELPDIEPLKEPKTGYIIPPGYQAYQYVKENPDLIESMVQAITETNWENIYPILNENSKVINNNGLDVYIEVNTNRPPNFWVTNTVYLNLPVKIAAIIVNFCLTYNITVKVLASKHEKIVYNSNLIERNKVGYSANLLKFMKDFREEHKPGETQESSTDEASSVETIKQSIEEYTALYEKISNLIKKESHRFKDNRNEYINHFYSIELMKRKSGVGLYKKNLYVSKYHIGFIVNFCRKHNIEHKFEPILITDNYSYPDYYFFEAIIEYDDKAVKTH